MDVLRELLKAGKEAKARGLDPDQAQEDDLPSPARPDGRRSRRTIPQANDHFKIYLVDWYLHRVYDELNGPLTDAISAIPPR